MKNFLKSVPLWGFILAAVIVLAAFVLGAGSTPAFFMVEGIDAILQAAVGVALLFLALWAFVKLRIFDTGGILNEIKKSLPFSIFVVGMAVCITAVVLRALA